MFLLFVVAAVVFRLSPGPGLLHASFGFRSDDAATLAVATFVLMNAAAGVQMRRMHVSCDVATLARMLLLLRVRATVHKREMRKNAASMAHVRRRVHQSAGLQLQTALVGRNLLFRVVECSWRCCRWCSWCSVASSSASARRRHLRLLVRRRLLLLTGGCRCRCGLLLLLLL